MPYTNPAPETAETFSSDGFDALGAPPVVQEFTPPHDALGALGWLYRARRRSMERRFEVSVELSRPVRPSDNYFPHLEQWLRDLDAYSDAILIFEQKLAAVGADLLEAVAE